MKTILQILPSLDKINGGVERGTLDVARELSKRRLKSDRKSIHTPCKVTTNINEIGVD